MSKNQDQLKLGKGTIFVKSRIKHIPQESETWEADFRALPKPPMQSLTEYTGLVMTEPHGFLLAHTRVEGRPSVNDLATILGEAMRRPLALSSHRPNRLLVRGHPQWKELFPHLKELGIEVVVQKELPQVEDAYQDYLRLLREHERKDMVEPTTEQEVVDQLFPATAEWVRDFGHIEIGEQEMFGLVVRAFWDGGMVFEDNKPATLAEALAALEEGLTAWMDKQGIE